MTVLALLAMNRKREKETSVDTISVTKRWSSLSLKKKDHPTISKSLGQ